MSNTELDVQQYVGEKPFLCEGKGMCKLPLKRYKPAPVMLCASSR